MAVLNTPRLGLPYPDGADLLRDGDNRIHDLAAALDDVDVVLTPAQAEAEFAVLGHDHVADYAPIDHEHEGGGEGPPGPAGPAGATGPAGPPGPSGQSAGKIFYFAPSDASDIAGYKTMLTSPSTGAEQTIATPCTGTGDVLIAAFATDPGVPGAVDYPAGTAFRRVYANVQAGGARLHMQVYKRDAAGTETLVRDELSDVFVNQTVALQEWVATGSAAGAVLATDRLVAKLYGQRTTGPTTVTVTTYYEGSAHTSHIQTTITAGAQGPAGVGVPTGGASGDVLTKTSATDYATGWAAPAGGGGGGGIASSWKGMWNAATTYAAGDLVFSGGSTWIAVAGSTGVSPTAPAAFTRLAGQSKATANFGDGTFLGGAQGIGFTPTSTLAINAVQFNRSTAMNQYGTVGIASALGATPAAVTWLVKNESANLNKTGWVTVPIPAITLNSGTGYFLVYTAPNGGGAFNFWCTGNSAGIYTALSNGTSRESQPPYPSGWGSLNTDRWVLAFDLGTVSAPWEMFAQGALPPVL